MEKVCYLGDGVGDGVDDGAVVGVHGVSFEI